MSIRIFLADLTHDTVGLATEVFPLNIGLVGAYALQRFGNQIDLLIDDGVLNNSASKIFIINNDEIKQIR